MAMLMMNDVFERTWGERGGPRPDDDYWPTVIRRDQGGHPDFVFMAEAYWDLEYALQQQGFDYCYDKSLYDRLEHEGAESVRAHLSGDSAYQNKLLRFLENHDEPRAAATFPPEKARAAAVTTLTQTGARLVYEGQLEGRRGAPARLPRPPARRGARHRAPRVLRAAARRARATRSSAAATGSSASAAAGRATTPGRTSSSGAGAATVRASSSS